MAVRLNPTAGAANTRTTNDEQDAMMPPLSASEVEFNRALLDALSDSLLGERYTVCLTLEMLAAKGRSVPRRTSAAARRRARPEVVFCNLLNAYSNTVTPLLYE